MAELSEPAFRAFVGLFVDAFNARHGSSFSVTAIEPADDLSVDYRCTDPRQPGEELKVQVTRAVTIVESVESAGQIESTAKPTIPMHAWLHNKKVRAAKSYSSDTPAVSAARAVEEKARRLGPSASDLVLLIVYDLQQFDDEVDLPEMIGAVARVTVPFREVWAVWSFQDKPGAARLLWPGSEEARSNS
jgi:hypothetical protein